MHVKDIYVIYSFVWFWNIVDHRFKQEKREKGEGWILQLNVMFRQFKEKNKYLLRLKLKSALKIEQISVVLKMRFILNRKSEFIIY